MKGSILKQAGPLMMGRGGAAVLSFATPLVLARLLSVSDYGTFKAAFLVITTAYFILQFGMAQGLYYFVPKPNAEKGALLTQSLLTLGAFGAIGGIALFAARGLLAKQFGNPELIDCALPMALIAFGMVASAPLEIQLTAEGDVRSAAVAIFISEGLRMAATVVPLVLGRGLIGLLWGNVLHNALRGAACLWLVRRAGGARVRPALFKEQLAYSLPFGAAVLLLIPQQTFHQWAVGAKVTPAEFAIYMVGCFQVPIINLLYSPISDVLQVKLAAPGGREHALPLFHEANLRLAAVFFPLCAGLIAAGPLFIAALFTHRYDASVPVFRIVLLTIPFAALPLDGTLRALGETPYLFKNSAVKLGVTIPAVLGGLWLNGMTGAIAAHAAVEASMRTAMLIRVRHDLRCSVLDLLPWRQLAQFAVAAVVACVPVLAVVRLAGDRPHAFAWLSLAGALYLAVYALALALAPGEGSPATRLKRALIGVA